jgi:2-polyprenyl-6-methoxyphenol hydroxylase-like FAD-dependent oxidoreductase
MLANQLARRGVRVRIIDRHPGPAQQSRALGVQARTLEIYAQLGIVREALELGTRATGVNMWTRGRRAARMPFGEIGTGLSPYPYLLILGQDDNEQLLGAALRRHGVAVEWNTELTGLTQHGDRVVATITHGGTTGEVTARWIGGCDGGRSAVRELNGIAFVGAPYEHVFYVADTELTGPMVPREINVYLWREGFHLFFPMRGDGHWRVVGILPPAMRGRADLTLDDVLPWIRAEAGPELTLRSCRWFSTYRIHHRRAERFRTGRCFLMGDAAHVHSPVGAQGMNTGLQDAYNLAWKLALVVAGHAGDALLDSYGAEREPVAQRLLSTTDQAFGLIVADTLVAALFRTRILAKVLALAMSVSRIRRLAFRTISQTGIRYRHSALSQALPGLPDDAPRAGDRFPWVRLKLGAAGGEQDLYEALDDTRFTLILIGQDGARHIDASVLGDLLRTVVITPDAADARELARASLPARAFYLLRPDGHIALSGPVFDPAVLSRYVTERISFLA